MLGKKSDKALLVTPNMSLVGASGGVYSIVLAFLANVILNFDVMTVVGKVARVIPVAVFLCLAGVGNKSQNPRDPGDSRDFRDWDWDFGFIFKT